MGEQIHVVMLCEGICNIGLRNIGFNRYNIGTNLLKLASTYFVTSIFKIKLIT